jgi:hypothetical protein
MPGIGDPVRRQGMPDPNSDDFVLVLGWDVV